MKICEINDINWCYHNEHFLNIQEVYKDTYLILLN